MYLDKTKEGSYMYYYKFEDGYFLYTVGRLTRSDKAIETRKHGKIVFEQPCNV